MFGFISNIGPWELIFILLVALIVVGPGKLPEVARSVGKTAAEFRRTTSGIKKEFQEVISFEDEQNISKSSSMSNKDDKDDMDDSIDISDIEDDIPEDDIDDSMDISDIEDNISEDDIDEYEQEHNPYR